MDIVKYKYLCRQTIDNGKDITIVDKSNEIIQGLGNLTNNGTYYFVSRDGVYVPTNSATYQKTNGENSEKENKSHNELSRKIWVADSK